MHIDEFVEHADRFQVLALFIAVTFRVLHAGTVVVVAVYAACALQTQKA